MEDRVVLPVIVVTVESNPAPERATAPTACRVTEADTEPVAANVAAIEMLYSVTITPVAVSAEIGKVSLKPIATRVPVAVKLVFPGFRLCGSEDTVPAPARATVPSTLRRPTTVIDAVEVINISGKVSRRADTVSAPVAVRATDPKTVRSPADS